MKKCSSLVWQYFERIEEDKRCVAVLCKLCDTRYKYFGNTTNLRVHLKNKHPVQWEFSQTGTLDPTKFHIEEVEETSPSSPPQKRNYTRRRKDKNVRYSVSVNKEDETESGIMPSIEILRVDVPENSDSDLDRERNTDTPNLVRRMHADSNSDEEWLEDPYQITHIQTYEPKPKKMKYKKIKREVISPTGLPGFYVAPKADRSFIYQEEAPKKDEYSVFGEYVANKLRKFKSPRTKGNLQQLITTILWQAEYGLYDNADTVKRILMHSIFNPEPEPISGTVDYDAQIHTVHQEEVVEPDIIEESAEQTEEGVSLGVIE